MNLTDSRSVNENDGWVFDDLAFHVLEEESVRRSISGRIRCTCRQTYSRREWSDQEDEGKSGMEGFWRRGRRQKERKMDGQRDGKRTGAWFYVGNIVTRRSLVT